MRNAAHVICFGLGCFFGTLIFHSCNQGQEQSEEVIP